MIISCSSNKVVYWCGDHPCINKKEKKAYFKKNMIVEMKSIKSKNYKNNSEIEKIMQESQKKRKNKKKDVLLRSVKLDENDVPRYIRIPVDDDYDYNKEEST